MWGSPYFSPITSPAAAAGNGFSPRAQANPSQQPSRVQQQFPKATPIQYPLVRPRVVTSIQPFGSPQPFSNAFNPRTVSQNIPQPSQMLPPTNQLANRMTMHQPSPRMPSSAPPSSPFNSPLWQSRNAPPFMPSHGLAPQQSLMPATGPFPRGVVAPAKQPVIPSSTQTPGGVLPPPQRPFLSSNVPSGFEIVKSPQQPYAALTAPSPGMTVSVPHIRFTSPNVPSSQGVPPAPPAPPPPPSLPGQRPLLSSTFPSLGRVPSAGQRQTTPLTVPPPAGVLSPPLPARPFVASSMPSQPQRPFAPSTVPPSRGFQIPLQRPFTAPTVPSTRGLLSPPKQPFVPATFSSPRGISSTGLLSSSVNSVLQSGFLSPPQRPFVCPAVPSPGGIASPVQHVSPFNSSSLRNAQPLSPGINQRPSAIPTPVQQPLLWQWPLRHSQPSGFGFTRGPVAAALDKNAAIGGLKQMPGAMHSKETNVQPTPVNRQFIPTGRSTQWRSRSSFARGGIHKGDVGRREHENRRTYSNSPRISRCFSPPPPDIKRVVRFVMSDDYYKKSQDHQGVNCDVQGTEKLMELHDRFEKEVLNMASLEQEHNDDENISNRRDHQKDGDNSDIESLSGSDGNDSPVKSRLRLFPSDDEDNSDEDDSEAESHALSDSTSDSNNDDDDSHTGGGLSDDDDDDDDNDAAGYDHNHRGPSVAEIRKRKIENPKRLHPELWFNEVGETNDGPVCRCSASDKQQGIRHSVYPGETAIKPCNPLTNNAGKLHHYWVTVTPHTNFMTSNPSTIQAEGRNYTFEGFSMFCHYPLEQLPRCSVIRFNIEYTLHVISQPVPENFCVKDLDLFSEFLFYKVLELADWNFTGQIQDSCQRYHFMPRFVYRSSDKDDSKECHELLPMNQVLSHIVNSAEPLIKLNHFDLDKEKWDEYSKSCRNAIVMNPAKKPVALRVDNLYFCKDNDGSCNSKVYPYIVHHSIRPVQMSFAGDPKYQRLLKTHNKLRNLISNTPVPTRKNQDKLVKLKIELEKMRVTSSMRRDVVVEVSSRGMIKTGLKSDVCQHALLLPVLVHHVRYHMCLHSLDSKMGYAFKDRALLQLALTHPSYHLNFGMNPDHARNSLSNCGVKQPRYGDRKVRHLHTRKKGITQLIRVMSNLGKMEEYQSIFADDYGTVANPMRKSTSRGRLIGGKTRNKLERIRHNERLEFLGDAVLELICSAHLYFMLPSKPEGGLAMYRSALVQNRHLAQLAKKLGLSDFMQYSHGPDLCLEEDLNHAMANCFEALLGALYLENGLKSATELFTKLAFDEEELRDVWTNFPKHPLQAQQPDGDRHLIASSELLQKLQEFEQASGIEFTHIRLLARAFTHAQVGFNNLTLGSNQRMEFLGDSVLQFVVSVYLFNHFPEHHEGHLTLLRSSLVNHRIQAKLARELGLDKLINFGAQAGLKAFREKLLADILEAFVAALYVDKGLRHVEVFCRVCLFPRLEEFIINQDWMDAKSQLQQCCLTSREQGKTPDLPQYKVLQNKGPAHHKHYTVAVYYKNKRLGSGEGKSIQQAEMAAAKDALGSHYFPELARQKRLLDRKHQGRRRNYWNKVPRREREKEEDQEEVEFEPQWEEMETFEVEWNRRSEENWGGDKPETQEKEIWELDDRSSEADENWDAESSEDRENWEEEINLTKDNWEEQRISTRETWQGEKRNMEENSKGNGRDLRENSSEINGTKENWEEKRGQKWEEETGELKENWEKEMSDARSVLEQGNGGTKEHCEEQTSFATENWEEERKNWMAESSDIEETWESNERNEQSESENEDRG